MGVNRIFRGLHLPRSWPRRVRSAVIHTISLAQASMTATHSWAGSSYSERLRLKANNGRLRQEVSCLREELRIKDARLGRIPAHRRPHYPPVERLAILELRAARNWSLAQTADRFLVTPATVASWTWRLDEDGPAALVQISQPVNKFPEFVGYVVRRLKVLCPSMGKARIARVLCRAGLHLGSTTVRRMLQGSSGREPGPAPLSAGRTVTARRPNHVWHADLTTVPTSLGFWTSWLPWALPQRWPFCWWIAVAVDHFSRRVMGTASFKKEPASLDVRAFLKVVIRRSCARPSHLISDRGVQFTARVFQRWCRRTGIRQRYGAVGRYGSIAIVERLIRTLKTECTRQLVVVPLRRRQLDRELALWARWHNCDRPHEALRGATPAEVFFGQRPACRSPRFEPRARWPRRSRCAGPQALVRGQPGVRLKIRVSYRQGRNHLPAVELNRAA